MARVSIYSAGSNARGQLSLGSNEDSHIFTTCGSLNFISKPSVLAQINCIVAGANHTLLLFQQSDGTRDICGCGDGSRGQLGPKYREVYGLSPTFQLVDLSQTTVSVRNIKFIAASWETSFIVFSEASESGDDVLISMGANDFGELGIGETDIANPTAGSLHTVNFNHLFPSHGQKWRLRITQLRTGPRHVVVRILRISKDGQQEEKVVGWGASRHGQLGATVSRSIPYISKPQIISCNDIQSLAPGNQHTIFLQYSGSAIGLGSNKKNQICNISVISDVRLVGATWSGTYLVSIQKDNDSRWRIYATGSNTHGQLGIPSSEVVNSQPIEIIFPAEIAGTDILDLACGSEHVLILVRHRRSSLTEVWGWGWNEHGNLGLGHNIDVKSPRKIWPLLDRIVTSKAVGIWAGCGTSWIAVEE